jgi:hypothetical protein
MVVNISLSRQRVPMLDASTLEDRTRPALDGSAASRLRYFSWPSWAAMDHTLTHQQMPTQARLGRR